MNRGPRTLVRHRSIPRLSLFCLLVSAISVVEGQEQRDLFDDNGYRMQQFRSPVPDRVPGARTILTAEVKAFVDSAHPAPVLIDVLPTPPKPEGLSATALWLPPNRYNIPSSTWLPNVGYGRLSDELDNYFRINLEGLSGGDRERPIIIYCLADCWMSWNAARRAAEYGYSQILWYPEGTTGWEEAELPLDVSTPQPINDLVPTHPTSGSRVPRGNASPTAPRPESDGQLK